MKAGLKVVVVGAGVIGLFCAWRLQKRGAAVTVLDANTGHDLERWRTASVYAAGMLGPISEAVIEPAHAHPRLWDLALAGLDAWEEGERGLPGPPALKRGGALILAETSERRARCAAIAQRAAASGRRMQRVDAGAAAQSAPGLHVGEAEVWAAPDEAVADIGLLGRLMQAAPIRLGATVVGVEARGVRLAMGERLAADAVVLAPGAAAGALARDVPPLAHVSAAKGQTVRFLGAIAPSTVRAQDVYLAVGSRWTVAGASMEPGRGDWRADPAISDTLIAGACALAPGLAAYEVERAGAGVRAMSPDWAPMIGPAGPAGVIVAAGHSRNGWLLAPLTAEIVSAYVFGDPIDPLWAAFTPNRFETDQ